MQDTKSTEQMASAGQNVRIPYRINLYREHIVKDLMGALGELYDECKASRRYIVVDDDNGFDAYNKTGAALVRAYETMNATRV